VTAKASTAPFLSRRRWLWLGSGLSAGLLTGGLWWRQKKQVTVHDLLPTLVDTIIPADRHLGALAAGALAAVLKQRHSNQIIEQLYQQGLETLARMMATRGVDSLNSLNQQQREAMLREMQSDSSNARVFVNHLVEVVMTHYYSSSAGYASLNYVPPVRLVAARAGMNLRSCG